MNEQLTTIEISKEYLHFGAAHFTIFDAENREHLHGHNFHVTLDATAPIHADGITFDYNLLKNAVKALCDELDEQVLMPTNSPHLAIEQGEEYIFVIFNGERIPFLERDLTLLPIRNITVEELAGYFLDRLLADPNIAQLDLRHMVLRCASGAGQWAAAHWSPEDAPSNHTQRSSQ
ncbi:MAG: 6-carboxytetrahydropterin synthase [Pseudomonadota bacterium]